MRYKSSESRRISKRHMKRFRRNIDYAFTFGSVVAIRTKVRQGDPDGMLCPICWDPVRGGPSDPECPSCYGAGLVHGLTLTGYRYSVLSHAHISSVDDRFTITVRGQEYTVTNQFWVNYTEWALRDGDLIAQVEADNVDNPRFIEEIKQFYEVISARETGLHPGHGEHLNLAQFVDGKG